MRITTNQILRNYKSNLGTSLSNLDIARTRVMTGRKFNSTAEDPVSSVQRLDSVLLAQMLCDIVSV